MLSYSRRAKARSRFWTHLAKRWKACMLARLQNLTFDMANHCITFSFLVFVSSAECWCLCKGNKAAVTIAELEITWQLAVSCHPLGIYIYKSFIWHFFCQCEVCLNAQFHGWPVTILSRIYFQWWWKKNWFSSWCSEVITLDRIYIFRQILKFLIHCLCLLIEVK